MAAEYIVKEGNPEVILCERGIRTFETATRNTLDVSAIPVLKHGDPPAGDRRPVATGRAGATSCCRSRAPPSPPAPTGSSSRCTRGPRRRSATGRSRFRRRSSRSSRPRSARSRPSWDARSGGSVKIEPAAAIVGHVAVPGRQVDLAPRRAARRARRGRDARPRLRPLRRHASRRSTRCARSASRSTTSADDELIVHGVGLRGLRPPAVRSTAATRARSMRLLAGMLAGQDGRFELTGDESLSARPMERDRRAAAPDGRRDRDDRRPRAARDRRLGRSHGIDYELPVASAQVKSAILLAGLARPARRPWSSRRRRATTPS